MYYDPGELEPGRQHVSLLDPAIFVKFDRIEDVSRVYDVGELQIYDTRSLLGQR
jgi:hypothetical protein